MKKFFYWSPHISNVATIKNVINSAKSLKLYSKKPIEVTILDAVGEWQSFKEELDRFNINLFDMNGIKLKKYLPISGYFKSRIVFFIITLTKYFSLKKILKNQKPDFLIIHLITILPIILLIFSKFKTKFILRISGLPRYTFLRKILWKIVAHKIYLVTCPSLQTKVDLSKLKLFPEHKLKVLYDPILEINKINSELKKQNTNIYNEKKYFINIGRLTKQKNQMLLINAFSEVLEKHKNLFLLIVGEGEERKNLQKFIIQKKLDKNIFLAGYINNVYPLIKSSLAVISSSLWEDPGAVMIEGSYCGKNIISSDCKNGPKEFLSNGKGGYLFTNNDKTDLVDKMEKFLNDNYQDKFKKILLCKKKSKNYTMFNHYKVFFSLFDINKES